MDGKLSSQNDLRSNDLRAPKRNKTVEIEIISHSKRKKKMERKTWNSLHCVVVQGLKFEGIEHIVWGWYMVSYICVKIAWNQYNVFMHRGCILNIFVLDHFFFSLFGEYRVDSVQPNPIYTFCFVFFHHFVEWMLQKKYDAGKWRNRIDIIP